MRSPTTVGEPWPRPGTGVFQRMFSASLHWRGGFCPGTAMPSRVGPRHAGQSVGEIEMGVDASVDQARPTQAKAKIVSNVFLFIRVSVGSLAKT